MSEPVYVSSKCLPCAGTGEAYDATMADKVDGGGETTVRCSHCDGKGEVSRLAPSPSALAMEARLKAGLAELHADAGAGEIPDWML